MKIDTRPLAGQTALVTGASSGIGRATALALASAGANVAINHVCSEAEVSGLLEQIHAMGVESIAVHADISEEKQVQSMFARLLEKFGTLDILINNAAVQDNAPIDAMTLEQWQRVIDVNLTGQFLCTREAVREFKRRGGRSSNSRAVGKIVFIGSVHQAIPWAGHANYASSKAAVEMLAKSVAQEVAHLGIRVNCVAPGVIETPMTERALRSVFSRRGVLSLVPAQRAGQPEEIARVAVWLCADEADYIHGTTILVDGGMSLYSDFARAFVHQSKRVGLASRLVPAGLKNRLLGLSRKHSLNHA